VFYQRKGTERRKKMKFLAVPFFLIAASFVLTGSGCTKIDTPTRNPEEPGGELSLTADFLSILDTQPLRIQAHGAKGVVSWRSDPHFDGCFQPDLGDLVLFSPPDVGEDLVVGIVATDETGSSARLDVRVIDEGEPPAPGDVLINEIAWSGTLTSAYDEYIELLNTTDRDFYLTNWRIENAAGAGNSLVFSGRLPASSVFLIANYAPTSGKSALTCRVDHVDAAISLPNSAAGPYVLTNSLGTVFHTAGDGGSYVHGKNSTDLKASMSRYSFSADTVWNPDSWYTESVCMNLADGTLGTPGHPNSDLTGAGPEADEDAATAVITEFFIDVNEEAVEDWVELLVTEEGNVKQFVISDLDGDSDSSITGGLDAFFSAGEYILIVWSDTGGRDGNTFSIADPNPTGTKDELVLLCGGRFLDGLCYCSTGEALFDDGEKMAGYGWAGPPIPGKYAARRRDQSGGYLNGMQAESWDVDAEPTPAGPNPP
jgi:hypothetical protein